MTNSASRHIEIYDTTLRDGTQGQGVSLSLVDKIKIAKKLDALGVDYIEGGFPLSNPKDEAFFDQCRQIQWQHARICAFGMTRRRAMKPGDDPGMQALVKSGAPVIAIVGKTWDLHVDEVLRVDRHENLDMIRQSVEFCRNAERDVFYDAEHFFDGYRENPDYAIETLRAALDGGATRLILCDTNGGSLPRYISRVVGEVSGHISNFRDLGIHTHNDSGMAVACTLAAVETGCIQVQGTINGIGERCGNADLTSIVANLRLKMGYECLQGDSMQLLTETSRFVYELANQNIQPTQPFVGPAAFAHKGGMHVHAVQRTTRSYEHIDPELVGNTRRVLMSELAGRHAISAVLGDKVTMDDAAQRRVISRVQDLEHQGYQFEAAPASFELLVQDVLGTRETFWQLLHYRCVILKRAGESPVTEAIVKLNVNGTTEHRVAEGDGPVNALDGALRQCLAAHYPQLANVHLRDFKVRVVNPTAESAAKVRVIAEFAVTDDQSTTSHFATVGVNENIVDASWQALADAFDYYLSASSEQPSTGEGANRS